MYPITAFGRVAATPARLHIQPPPPTPICPRPRSVIISNPTVSKAEAAAKKFNVPNWTGDDMEVINHPDVEAVWICSPSSFHADQIKACAAAGKHVFCEKPIATDLPETIEAINACKVAHPAASPTCMERLVPTDGARPLPATDHGCVRYPATPDPATPARQIADVKLMTALQRRFDPNFARVREAITNNEIGSPIVAKLCSRDPAPPPFSYVEGSGGIFKDMAVHDLDMSRFLMGEEPEAILAYGACMIDKEIEKLPGAEAYDTASVIIKYPGGKHAFIDVCRQAPYGYDQRAEVLGTKGMIQTDNMYPNTARVYTNSFTGNADMPYDFFMSRYKEAYIRESEAFCKALVNDEPSPCSGEV
mmetsp:Transcript_43148/g.116543  ORF Transcript_43148/g.116543 Transcript_43148/m.116543 type:complete len:362 (-) Transcript_43148:885-1970(-)